MKRWKHSCAATPKCSRLISQRFLFCGPCWRLVPVALQVAINESFRQLQKQRKIYLDLPHDERRIEAGKDLVERAREYAAARDAAIAIVRGDPIVCGDAKCDGTFVCTLPAGHPADDPTGGHVWVRKDAA